MNLDTGEIKRFESDEARDAFMNALLDNAREKWTKIDAEDMTEKQAEEMQVSKHDTRSPLGKIYTSARKRRKAARKSN